MSGRHDFNAQHVALTLLALLISAVLGATIPMLQANSLGISQPGRRSAATATSEPPAVRETRPAATDPSAAAGDLNAAGGALIAWQEPDPATPTSTLMASPAASLTAPPATDGSVHQAAIVAPIAVARAIALPSIPLPADPPDVAASQFVSATAISALIPGQVIATPASTMSSAQAAAVQPTPAPDRPKNTPAPRAVVAAAATPAPAAPVVAPPQRVMPPALLNPALEGRRRGEVQFEWFPTSELPRGAAYEVVVWSPEQDPNQAWGVAPPRTWPALTLNLDELFRSGRFPTGNLYWTVLVVEQNPYRRLTQPAGSERRYLVYASEGAGAEGNCCALSR